MSSNHEIQRRTNRIMKDLVWLADNNMLTAYNPANGELFDVETVGLNGLCIQIDLIPDGFCNSVGTKQL